MTEKELHNEYRKSDCKTFTDFLINKITELEKENRLLGERCNQLLKDKGDLADKIADIKANCDLAIEGRDIKIKELEQKLEQTEKDLADYQFNYPSIKELETEHNKLLDVINNQDIKIADLEKQIEQIQDAKCTSCTELGGMQLKINRLEQQNKALQTSFDILKENDEKVIKQMVEQIEQIEKVYDYNADQLTKATKLLKEVQGYIENNDDVLYDEIEQFLKEIEK